MTQISEHFTLEELTFSQIAMRTGLDNTPAPADVENLTRLCGLLLEPARAMLGVPLHVDSGFRSHLVNSAIGGALDSAHLEGRAADIVPIGMSLREAFDKLRGDSLPYDQLIIECNAWLHISIAAEHLEPRREDLVASGGPGHWTYALA